MKNNGWVIPGQVTPSMSQWPESDTRERNGVGTGSPGRDEDLSQAHGRQLLRQRRVIGGLVIWREGRNSTSGLGRGIPDGRGVIYPGNLSLLRPGSDDCVLDLESLWGSLEIRHEMAGISGEEYDGQ
jgi:hypothetical protein